MYRICVRQERDLTMTYINSYRSLKITPSIQAVFICYAQVTYIAQVYFQISFFFRPIVAYFNAELILWYRFCPSLKTWDVLQKLHNVLLGIWWITISMADIPHLLLLY